MRLVVLVALVVACSGQPPAPTPTLTLTDAPTPASATPASPTSPAPASPTPTASAGAASPTPDARQLPSPVTPVEPGRYTKAAFSPALSFAVGDGWSAAQSTRGFFDIQDDPGALDVIAVQFANIPAFATAAAAAASVEARANLVVASREEVHVGGLPAIQLEVDTTDPADTEPPIFRDVINAAPGPLAIASGRRLQLNLMDTPDGVLAVLVGGSIANWEETLEMARPVLDSLVIDAD